MDLIIISLSGIILMDCRIFIKHRLKCTWDGFNEYDVVTSGSEVSNVMAEKKAKYELESKGTR